MCAACQAQLGGPPLPVARRLALPVTFAAGPYGQPRAGMIVHAKERGAWLLVNELGRELARAVAAVLLATKEVSPVALVPVPSAASAVRKRGLDVVTRCASQAVRRLRAADIAVHVAPCLRQRVGVRDQAGLGAAARLTNMSGAITVVRPPVSPCVVVDDVVTTGASLVAAVSVLRAAGVRVVGAATIAERC